MLQKVMLRQIKWPTDSAQVTYDVAKIAGLYVIPVESLMFPYILDSLLFKWTLSIITWIRQDPNRLPWLRNDVDSKPAQTEVILQVF